MPRPRHLISVSGISVSGVLCPVHQDNSGGRIRPRHLKPPFHIPGGRPGFRVSGPGSGQPCPRYLSTFQVARSSLPETLTHTHSELVPHPCHLKPRFRIPGIRFGFRVSDPDTG